MKKVISYIISSINIFFCATSFAQVGVSEIDPRQYITVQYRKFLTREKMDVLWKWEEQSSIPNQKIQYIDIDGEIRIDFSRIELSRNKDFEGVVSLEAEISGANGTRKIEVNPYSEIGVQRVPIGIKSEAPAEIAKKLLNMLLSLKEVDSLYYKVNGYQRFDIVSFNLNKNIISKVAELKKATTINLITDNIDQLIQLINSSYLVNISPLHPIDSTLKGMSAYREYVLNNFLYKYNLFYNQMREKYKKDYSTAFDYATDKTDLTLNYLSSFENAGEDATKAFFLLLNKDLISYKSLKNSLLNNQKRLSQVNTNFSVNDPKLDSTLLFNATLIINSLKTLTDLSSYRGSTLENILFQNYINNKPISTTNSSALSPNVPLTAFEKDMRTKALYLTTIDEHFQKISDTLSAVAGRNIYKKLIYATIDLGKSGAKDGEVLNLYLTWILDSRRDSLANSPRLAVGKYYLRQTGLQIEISDMFSLVKRLNEQNPNLASNTISPTNFKGAGGAVLMWTFNKEDKGLKLKEKNGEFKVTSRNKFSNFLEPSVGLNVSYLDFSTDKDVEIGTGIQLGLFRNKVFFGYGVNLHLLSPKNQSPTYFFIGFSFAKLSDLFKTNNNIVASQ